MFTFTDEGELLVYPVSSGDVVPFWSSRTRLEAIQRRNRKYRQWQITELSLNAFWKGLDQLEAEGVMVGVTWSGEQLTGYTVTVADLRKGMRYWIDRLVLGDTTIRNERALFWRGESDDEEVYVGYDDIAQIDSVWVHVRIILPLVGSSNRWLRQFSEETGELLRSVCVNRLRAFPASVGYPTMGTFQP